MRVSLPKLYLGRVHRWNPERGEGDLLLVEDERIVRFCYEDGRVFRKDEIGRTDFGDVPLSAIPFVDEEVYCEVAHEGGIEIASPWGTAVDFSFKGGITARNTWSVSEGVDAFVTNYAKTGKTLRVVLDGTVGMYDVNHLPVLVNVGTGVTEPLFTISSGHILAIEYPGVFVGSALCVRPLKALTFVLPSGFDTLRFREILARHATELTIVS